MNYTIRFFAAAAFGALAAGCVTVVPVPGADKVRLTNTAADVAACTAKGNVSAPVSVDPGQVLGTLRNQAVGLGANTVFIADANADTDSGVAYHCP
jgi:hypothetical protein